ncbi:MAG: FtsX-like permease family protein, partial [Candidatus Cloacimonadaceae bacterium]|nr:FtsX-like permease family protein [Candidatus Cloacimonadaceae bacterium]
MALLCVTSVMNGFRNDMQRRITGTLAQIRISHQDQTPISEYESIISICESLGFQAAPVNRAELLLKSGGVIEPSMCFGIDFARHQHVNEILRPMPHTTKDNLRQGIVAGVVDEASFEEGGIILGSGLAYKLDARLGDTIQIVSPMFTEPTAFGLLPKVRSVKVLAIFAAGMPEYDAMYSYVPLGVTSYFGGSSSAVDYIEVRSGDMHQAPKAAQKLSLLLPDYQVRDWSSFDPSLYNAIRFEKYMMLIIMLMMYIIASFNLTGNMLKTIAQKKMELGLLKAIGYRDRDLSQLFMYKAMLITTLGVLIGLAFALVLLLVQREFGIIKLSAGPRDYIALPVLIQIPDFLLIILLAYGLSILSTLFPLRQLRQIETISLIRNNLNN